MAPPLRRRTAKYVDDGDESDASSLIIFPSSPISRPKSLRPRTVVPTEPPSAKAIGKRKERPADLCVVEVPSIGRASSSRANVGSATKKRRLLLAYVDVPVLAPEVLKQYTVVEWSLQKQPATSSSVSRRVPMKTPRLAVTRSPLPSSSRSPPPSSSARIAGPSRPSEKHSPIAALPATPSRKRKSIGDDEDQSDYIPLDDSSDSEYESHRPSKRTRSSKPISKETRRHSSPRRMKIRDSSPIQEDASDDDYSSRKPASLLRAKTVKTIDNSGKKSELSEGRVSCHQCRRSYVCRRMNCATCTKTYCEACVRNRYDFPFLPEATNFSCPKCIGNCNCDFCMAARGTWNRLIRILGINENGKQVRLATLCKREGVTAQHWFAMNGFAAEGGLLMDDEPQVVPDSCNEDDDAALSDFSSDVGFDFSASMQEGPSQASRYDEDRSRAGVSSPQSASDPSSLVDTKGKMPKRPRPAVTVEIPGSTFAAGSSRSDNHLSSVLSSKPPSLVRSWEYSSDSTSLGMTPPRSMSHATGMTDSTLVAHSSVFQSASTPSVFKGEEPTAFASSSTKQGPDLVPDSPPYKWTSLVHRYMRSSPEEQLPAEGPSMGDDNPSFLPTVYLPPGFDNITPDAFKYSADFNAPLTDVFSIDVPTFDSQLPFESQLVFDSQPDVLDAHWMF